MELKDRLKYARKAKGLTQKQVTEQIKGLSQSAYSQLESGKSKSTTRAIELAHLFGVDVHWLISGEGEMKLGSLFIKTLPLLVGMVRSMMM